MKPQKPLLLQSCLSGRQTIRDSIDLHMIKKSLAIWAVIIPLAIANGFMRNSILEPLMGKHALPVSGITLCVMIFALCWLLIPRLGSGSQKTYVLIGIVWALLAAAFECALGIFLLGASWDELMSAYNPARGNLWLFVLLTIGLSPWFSARRHTRSRTQIHLRAQ